MCHPEARRAEGSLKGSLASLGMTQPDIRVIPRSAATRDRFDNENDMGSRTYYVYILASDFGSLYVGVTNDLERRILEHRCKLVEGFTKKYNLTKLVYVEECGEVLDAITREKQIKGWRRAKKVALIESLNPGWHDLGDGLSDPSLRSG
jgi:putative endonuclease